ncbi:hypothetical protein QJS10_CPA08g01565 [Acorus calamus]|uniref:Uncharacterized protein n=1 Tax=Acorus calamus TaxID=4465 RepID=A0AAV9E918_ACOCL|nr:hypothetical protein QJS10_CPA08g01565 [Acorus calamus]
MPSSTKFMHLEIPVHTSGFKRRGSRRRTSASRSGSLQDRWEDHRRLRLQQPVGAHLRGLIRSEDRRAVRENDLISVLVSCLRVLTSQDLLYCR